MAEQQRKTRRTYTPEYRVEAARGIIKTGPRVTVVAGELGAGGSRPSGPGRPENRPAS